MGLTLSVSELKKSYGGTVVLDGCSYRFEDGRVYAIMGPNGSGKSTFLRLCALIEKPDSGKADFIEEGVVIEHGLALMRRITLLLPSVGVFNTTVYENIAYGLKLRKVNKAEIEHRVLNAAEMVGLKDKIRRRAVTLSSGETQRMGLARALVISPSVLFLDEPTAAVDAKNSKAIEEIIQNMRHTLKATIILSTHDAGLAERAANTILILRDGRATAL
ncbi:ABC transporter ATP-binding protein [Candidatus Magnetominusculus dajiuhuensis]|uniref:ABC transporter ATP-binding protein n=1 Tax=Candidatus Magnetominusculus dajiuhuensis TaxID=3137712 RepID=UPI003B4311FF